MKYHKKDRKTNHTTGSTFSGQVPSKAARLLVLWWCRYAALVQHPHCLGVWVTGVWDWLDQTLASKPWRIHDRGHLKSQFFFL